MLPHWPMVQPPLKKDVVFTDCATPICVGQKDAVSRNRAGLVFYWRRKTASRAALHRRETERRAVVRHPRILPWPATTFWQSCAASLSQLRTTLLVRATHLLESFS